MRFSLLFLFSFFLLCQSVWSQTQQTLRVLTQSKPEVKEEAVPFATVIVYAKPVQAGSADEKGEYSFRALEGSYAAEVRCVGFQVWKGSITVGSNKTPFVVRLVRSESSLQGVVVSAGRFRQNLTDVTVSMELLEPKSFERINAQAADDALNRVPGVSVLNGQANIRGGSGFTQGAGSRVLLLQDGLPMLSADAGSANWTFVPIEMIDQVEVIKGAASAIYGSSALGGVVNIQTIQAGSKPKTFFSLSQQMYMPPPSEHIWPWEGKINPMATQVQFMHARKFGKLDFSGGINLLMDDGYRLAESSKRVRLTINTRYHFNKHWSAGVNTSMMADSSRYFIFWKNDSSAFFPAADAWNPQLILRMSVDPHITFTPNGSSRHQYRGRYYFTDNRNTGSRSANGLVAYNEYQYQKRHFLFSKKDEGVLTAGLVSIRQDVNSDSLYGEHYSQNMAAYLQLDQQWKRWNFNLGVRAERFQIDQYDAEQYLVFRSGVNYKAAEYTFLRASFGQGFRPPAVAERYVSISAGGLNAIANPNLKSEKGWSAEIGVKQGVKIGAFKAMLDVAGFYTHYNDMVEFGFGLFNGIFGAQARNLTNATLLGLDFSLAGTAQFKKQSISYLLAYTYLDTRDANFDNPDPSVGTQNSYSSNENFLKYRFRHMWKGDLEYRYGKWALGANMRFNSFMINIDQQFSAIIAGTNSFRERHSEGDFILDARLIREIGSSWKLSFILKNAFNRMYLIVPGNIGYPRSVNLLVSYRL